MSRCHLGLIGIMVAATLGLLSYGGNQARADFITVTFDSLPADFSPISTYTEKGFTIAGVTGPPATHFFTVTNTDNMTTAASFFRTDGVPMGFNFGGAPFSLISIDVPDIAGQAIFRSPSGATATVTETDAHKTFFFGPSFQGITSFQLVEIDNPLSGFEGFIVVDNLALLGPVPEPGGLALFVTVAISLITYGWRRCGKRI